MSKYLALLKKEWALSVRHRHMSLSLFFFSTIVILLIYFGLDVLDVKPPAVVPSVVWLAVVFGGTLQLNRTYDYERDEAVLDGMRLVPDVATPFYLSKLTINLIVLVLLAVFSSFMAHLLFSYPIGSQAPGITLPLLLGIVGIAATGTTFSTMVMVHHKRDILLPTIFYPLIVPLSIAVIKAMNADMGERVLWFKILLAFDVIYVTASILIFDKILESA